MRTGTETSPNEIVPLQIARAMESEYPRFRRAEPGKTSLSRRVCTLRKASPPSGGVDGWGRFYRPQLVERAGEKTVDYVERSIPQGPKTFLFLTKALETVDDRS